MPATTRTPTLDDVPEKHHPTPEERDERVSVPLPPEEFIGAVLATGPHLDEDDDEERPLGQETS